MEGALRVSGRCPEDVWKASGKCLEDVSMVTEWCLMGVWMVSGAEVRESLDGVLVSIAVPSAVFVYLISFSLDLTRHTPSRHLLNIF